MILPEQNLGFRKLLIIFIGYLLSFGLIGYAFRGCIDKHKYDQGYIDGYQSRIDDEKTNMNRIESLISHDELLTSVIAQQLEYEKEISK